MHEPVDNKMKRVILQNTHLIVFESSLEQESGVELNRIRIKLSLIAMQVEGLDFRTCWEILFGFMELGLTNCLGNALKQELAKETMNFSGRYPL
ncbi:hypothetical protein IC229_28845 [Spirosoma sp. BT702]|uniref:Uncharacterized protein n=1 Tax=Spirosoma profusum TaxID=2771354 RepID=A0A926Y157_9BACT|nr:hypothetical protein [Spirosoma profusum]MBD2704678.1 hypothetical protein [Spirosoma profusum]